MCSHPCIFRKSKHKFIQNSKNTNPSLHVQKKRHANRKNKRRGLLAVTERQQMSCERKTHSVKNTDQTLQGQPLINMSSTTRRITRRDSCRCFVMKNISNADRLLSLRVCLAATRNARYGVRSFNNAGDVSS